VTLDLADAQAFLAARFDGGASDAAPIGAGAWSRAFAFRHEGRDRVIRFGAHAEDFAKDRRAERFTAAALPIPRIVEIGEAFGGHFAIGERAFGRPLDDLDEAEVRASLPSLFAALDAVRFADIGSTSGHGAWDAEGTAPHASWAAALGPSPTGRGGTP
jgi:hygromycin-B 4-O-kinase